MGFYRFEHYRLDLNNACLTVSGQKVNLTPKAFDLLVFLCANPGRLIAKEALLDAVWQRRFISEGVLKNTIQELRKALGDDAKSPRYIETVPKRGYRFIADMINEAQPPAGEECIVGRDALLARLAQSLKQAALGRAEIVFLSGEPGIGKTTLIRAFMRQCADSALCAQGQCVEQYGQGEPYLPLLEAVNQLVRDGGGDKYRLLRRFAPTWLLVTVTTLADRRRRPGQCTPRNAVGQQRKDAARIGGISTGLFRRAAFDFGDRRYSLERLCDAGCDQLSGTPQGWGQTFAVGQLPAGRRC